MDYEKLAKTVITAIDHVGSSPFGAWAPVPDGRAYIGSPLAVGFRKETEQIPMIVGSCLAEFDCVPVGNKNQWNIEKKQEIINARFGVKSAKIGGAFKKAYPNIDLSYAACLDMGIRPAVIGFMNRRRREAVAPVYNYIFAYESQMMGGQLLGHNGDLHFMFHNALYIPAMFKPEITERVQNEMAGAWAAFAATGSPNGQGLPVWEAYTEEKKSCMIFGDATELKQNHDVELFSIM